MDFSGISFKEVREQLWNGRIYHDYVFSVSGDTYAQFMDYFMEMCMVSIGNIRYGKEDEMIGIECIFPFNKTTKTEKLPDGLKEYLDKLINLL